jgi:predicted RNase H-like nuclease (RuvC/YqgF family)
MKNMLNPNNPSSSAGQAGSDKGPANNGAGQPGGTVDYEKMYRDLEVKLGQQGQELGAARATIEETNVFLEGIEPALKELNDNEPLTQAIMDGRIDQNLATAIIEGRVSIKDVDTAEKAYTEVKKELGGKEKTTSAEEMSKLVEEKINAAKKEMQSSIRENEELRNFESRVNDFINRTPDFAEYAESIDEWLQDHEEVQDIETAYYAVKGKMSEKEAISKAEEERAEHEKELALNAGGGGSKVTHIDSGDGDFIDTLIAPRSNPNSF